MRATVATHPAVHLQIIGYCIDTDCKARCRPVNCNAHSKGREAIVFCFILMRLLLFIVRLRLLFLSQAFLAVKF